MSFPVDPLDVAVELLLGGTWTNLVSGGFVYDREHLTITRGRSDEATTIGPSTCSFEVNNRDGRFSPRNPTGIYYGLIGRNTRMRVRFGTGSALYLQKAVDTDRLTTPDSAGLSVTGDIDIRIDIQRDHWGHAAGLANKYVGTGNQRSWMLVINADNTLSLLWSADGTATITKTSTVAVTVPANGRLALRATLDVNNGAAGNDVKFWTAATLADSFTQLGSTITTAGTTSIFDSTAEVGVGIANSSILVSDDVLGRIYGFELRNGIGGSLVGSLGLDSNAHAGDISFTDGQSNTWTVQGSGSIVDPKIRFSGEISEWPVRWDRSPTDVYVPIVASGILRRLTQGASPLKSTLYRGYTTLATPPKAYWPCEDESGATRLASAVGGPPMTVAGTPQLALNTDFVCSEALPVVSSSEWSGVVPAYTSTGAIQVWILVSVPAAGATNGQGIFSLYTEGTVRRWTLIYASTGGVTIKGYDSTDAEVENSGGVALNLNGNPQRIDMTLQQSGADVAWTINGQNLNGIVGGTSGTFTTQTLGRATRMTVNPGQGLGDVAFGHVSVHSEIRNVNDLVQEFLAYDGETAGNRILRLCREEGITFRGIGDMNTSAAMGPQLPGQLIDLIQEAVDVDNGILFEPRDVFGLGYRSLDGLLNQPARLALDYAGQQLSALEPTDDDQHVLNDVTVVRQGGSSFRFVQDTGTLSIQVPPTGVGRYDTSVTVNLHDDVQLEDAAGWRVHLGTVDEARYSLVGMNLAHLSYTSNATLTVAAEDLDVGDRVTINNPPAWMPPDDITLLAQGFTETMGAVDHTIAVNCSPESPYGQAAIYDDSQSRYTSDGSTLSAGVTSTATSLSVATPSGPLWSHADGNFDIRVAGEVMTVIAITGSTSPQTFTVTRSVNGVVKAQVSGAEVQLDHVRVYIP